MKSDENIIKDLKDIEAQTIEKACEYLRNYDYQVESYIANVVASLCDVDVDKMLSDTSVAFFAQARWLYWYAVRYMNNETYEKIAERTQRKSGYSFTPNGIGQSINKMASMIATEPIWNKRWVIIKRIIKLKENIENDSVNGNNKVTIKVVAPTGVDVQLYKKD